MLYVDTANITETSIEENSWLGWADREGKNEDWYTEVKPGDTVSWLGFSTSSPNDVVNITKIRYKGENDLFGKAKLNGDGGSPEKVIGTINNLPKWDEEIYSITFTVYNGNNGGKRNGKFQIDPKLRMN